MVYRVYVEKKPGYDHEAHGLLSEIRSFLGAKALTGLRLRNEDTGAETVLAVDGAFLAVGLVP